MIILKDGEVDVADKEAINLLRWMRRHHLLNSIRALFAIADFQCFLALGPLCLASLLSAMLEMWHIVVQGWGQALGNVLRTAPAHGVHKEL